MLKLIDGFMPKLWPWLALGLAVGVLLQQLRVQGLQVDLAELVASQAKAGEEQAQRAQAATENKAGAILEHAGNTQGNVYEYMQAIHRLEVGRTADAGLIASLQHSLRTTATAHAQAASDLAACRSLGDQHQRLADLAARGAGLVGRSIDLVKQRDAEVNVLHNQVQIERQLVERLSMH